MQTNITIYKIYLTANGSLEVGKLDRQSQKSFWQLGRDSFKRPFKTNLFSPH